MTTVRHLVCTRPGTAWEEAVRPWFALLGREAWAANKPVAALVPDGVAASVLKRRLAEEGLPLVGIDIFTPGRLRHRLAAAAGEDKPVAVREELTLFLRLAVQALPDNAFARAVLAEPTAFLRDFDALDAAGWEGDEFRFAPANELARALREQLDRAGMQTAADAARLPVREEPVFSHLLVTGFGPAQSEHFFLLRSALAAAEEATVIFSQPISDSPLDFAFTETWESLLGPAAAAPGEAELLAEPEAEPAFLLAPDPCVEAKLVVDQVTRWLAGADEAVIGVVFPHRGLSLPREIALGLEAAKLPHYDAGGYTAARPAGFQLLEAWRAMQESQRLQETVDFVRCLRAHRELAPEPAEKLLNVLREVFREAMTDDLAVLRAAGSAQPEAAEFFSQWPTLPAQATLGAFAEAARPVLERFAWPERLDFLTERVALLAPRLEGTLERAAFLGWLAKMVDRPGRARSESGRHPLSRVALVTVEEALCGGWTHLIFTGMNGRQWEPPGAASGLLDETLVRELNARAGYTAEGAAEIDGTRGRLLAPADRATLAEAAFWHLTTQTAATVACTAARRDNPAATRASPLNDLFLKAYHLTHDSLPDEAACARLEAACAARLPASAPAGDFPGMAGFIGVHQNRRNPALPFDGHFFGFDLPPEGGLDFSFSQWEEAFKNPGTTWIKQAIRADLAWNPDAERSLAQAVGLWVHDWMNPLLAGGTWVPIPEQSLWQQLAQGKARAVEQRFAAAYEQAGRRLPDWWSESHAGALARAGQLIGAVLDAAAGAAPRGLLAGEYVLPEGELELFPGGARLRVRGRLDLILHEGPDPENAPGAAWLIDYKTGSRKPLTAKRFSEGDGLQLGLYSLALRQLGFSPVTASLLVPGEPLKPQLTDADVQAANALLMAVSAVHQSGTLGHRGAFRDRFSFSGHYPLATLVIGPAILKGKWLLTHPGLDPDGEEDEA
ncbi:MAG: PD-(D/E)XK nuclease family protein [Verrucomicrobiota bacterium JB024]|nr:PD-(D/E)XK nuclease family protein [Verrucomicrobiota bacterium JB024]